MRDDAATQLMDARKAWREFGVETTATAGQARTAFDNLFTEVPAAARTSAVQTGASWSAVTVSATEAAAATSGRWRLALDDITAKSYNAIADLGSSAGNMLKSAVADPMGTVKRAVSGALEMLGPFGTGLAVIGTVAAACGKEMIELAQQARLTGESFYDIYEKTGMTVPAVSRLVFAFEAVGGSAAEVDRLLFMFNQRMENSAGTVEKGLNAIGLSIAEVQEMSADERIYAISNGLRAAGEDANLSAIAMQLLGRSGRDSLHLLLKPLEEISQGSDALAATWTKKNAKAAEDFSIELSTLAAKSKAAWNELGLHVKLSEELTYGWNRMKLAVANVALTVWDLVTAFGAYEAVYRGLTGSMGPVLEVSKEMTDSMKANRKADQELTDSMKANMKADQELMDRGLQPLIMGEAELKRAEEDLTKSVEAQTKAREESDKAMQTAMKTFREYIAAISGRLFGSDDIKNAVDYAEAIGRVENISAMNAEAQAEVASVMRKGTEALIAAGLSTDDLTSKFEAMRIAATKTGRDAQDAMEDAKVAAAEAARWLGDSFVVAGATAVEAVNEVTVAIGVLSAEVLKGWPTSESLAEAAMVPGSMLGFSPGGALQSVSGMMSFFTNWNVPGMIPGRATGGPVEAGRSYVVGEEQPELFVPRTSGSIIPSVGGGDVTVHVQVSGVWDPSTVRRMTDDISRELMRRTGRKFGSA